MSSLFHSNSLSSRHGRSLGLPSPSVSRTVPDTGSKQEKGAGKESNSPAIRHNIKMFFSLLPDLALFYFILAVDAALTAKVFLRGLAGAKEGTPAGQPDGMV